MKIVVRNPEGEVVHHKFNLSSDDGLENFKKALISKIDYLWYIVIPMHNVDVIQPKSVIHENFKGYLHE